MEDQKRRANDAMAVATHLDAGQRLANDQNIATGLASQ
jgi:hypothetical protein